VKPASGISAYFAVVAAVAWKDLRGEFRQREVVSTMLVFALLVTLVFNFALELEEELRPAVVAGIFWATLIFAGTLGLGRSLAIEKDRGCLDGLLLSPVDRSAVYFGKALANLLVMLVVAVVLLPVYAVLFNVNAFNLSLIGVIGLGCTGYAAVGTLMAGMAVQTRSRDSLLPVLLFPVAIPILVAGVKATGILLSGNTIMPVIPWVNLLVACDIIYIAVAFMVFDYVVQE
jgi:heme exporter protein B